MIQMENVTKQYANGVTAIKNLNLEIHDGEFVYVIGPSGAGKSTFVKMLYHELMPTSGTIKIDDFDFATMKPSRVPFLRRHIGIVFQDFKLLPRLTVYENIAYAMQVIEAPDEKIKDRVLEVLGLVVSNKNCAVFLMNYPVGNNNVCQLLVPSSTSLRY